MGQSAVGLESGSIDLGFEAGGRQLSGSLFLPPGDGPFPAVVFLAGSGDESYRTGWEGERRSWFWPELHAWFEARAFAVYVFDKPGIGLSEGDWRDDSFDDRAANTLAAVQALGERPEIDPARIGLLGHSQGGWIAMMASAEGPQEVAFLISLAGPAISVHEQIIEDTVNRWTCERRNLIGVRRFGLRMGLSTMGAVGRIASVGYLSRIVRYDPADDLGRLEQPMLALFGNNDIMVLPETNTPRLTQHFGRETGNQQLVSKTIDGLDHFFRKGEFCLGEPRPRTFAPEFWEAFETPEFWTWVTPAG